MKKDYEIKKEIVETAHMMNRKGLVGTYEGNISVKSGDRVYLTPSGHSKELLTEGQIICTDLSGNVIEGQLKPTSETPMHTKCYELRDDIGSVVHCHAPYATAYAQANMAIENKVSPEFMMLFGKVPLIPYGTPGSLDIINRLEDFIEDYDVFLLANHGVLAVGTTPLEAFSKTLSLEMLLQVEFIRKVIADGKNTDLPEDECEKLLAVGSGVNHGRKR